MVVHSVRPKGNSVSSPIGTGKEQGSMALLNQAIGYTVGKEKVGGRQQSGTPWWYVWHAVAGNQKVRTR